MTSTHEIQEMTDYRKILMLRSKGCGQREMGRSKVASREKMKEVYEAADRLGLSWPLNDNITNAELAEILFPGKYKGGCRYVEPDYPYIHQELAKPGVTMIRIMRAISKRLSVNW